MAEYPRILLFPQCDLSKKKTCAEKMRSKRTCSWLCWAQRKAEHVQLLIIGAHLPRIPYFLSGCVAETRGFCGTVRFRLVDFYSDGRL